VTLTPMSGDAQPHQATGNGQQALGERLQRPVRQPQIPIAFHGGSPRRTYLLPRLSLFQSLEKALKESSAFVCLLGQRLCGLTGDEPKVLRQNQLGLHFVQTAPSHLKEPDVISEASAAIPLGNVRWHRYGRSPQLLRQAKSLCCREASCCFVHPPHRGPGGLPSEEIRVISNLGNGLPVRSVPGPLRIALSRCFLRRCSRHGSPRSRCRYLLATRVVSVAVVFACCPLPIACCLTPGPAFYRFATLFVRIRRLAR